MGVPPLSDPLTAVDVEAPALTANVSHIPGLEPVLAVPDSLFCPADGPRRNQCRRQSEAPLARHVFTVVESAGAVLRGPAVRVLTNRDRQTASWVRDCARGRTPSDCDE